MDWPDVALYSGGKLIGELAGYTDVSLSYVWRGVPSAQFTVPGVPDFLSAVPDPARSWVDVVVPWDVPWTGHITDVSVLVDAERGVRTEITAVGSKAVLNGLRLYPDPTAALSNQGAQETYQLVAPARTAVETVVSTAAARQGVPILVAPVADGDFLGGTVHIEARMDPVLDVLEKALSEQAMGIVAQATYPGVPPLTDRVEGEAGSVVVDVVSPRLNTHVQWRECDLSKGELRINCATAGQLIVGGDGQGKARQYLSTSDQDVSKLMFPWGGLQSYVDAASQGGAASAEAPPSAPPHDPLADARTAQAWADVSGASSLVMEAPDGEPYRFGKDYMVGDVVLGEIAGVTARAQVTEVEVKAGLDGVSVVPKIGEATAPPMSELAVMVADLKRSEDRRKRWV